MTLLDVIDLDEILCDKKNFLRHGRKWTRHITRKKIKNSEGHG